MCKGVKYKNKYINLKNQIGGKNNIYIDIFEYVFNDIDNSQIFNKYKQYYKDNILQLTKENSSLERILYNITGAETIYNLFKDAINTKCQFREGNNLKWIDLDNPKKFIDAYETLYKIFSAMKDQINLTIKTTQESLLDYKQKDQTINNININNYASEINKINSIVKILNVNQPNQIFENIYYTIFLWYIRKLMVSPDIIKKNDFIFPYISDDASEILNIYSYQYYSIILEELEYKEINTVQKLFRTMNKLKNIRDKIVSFEEKLKFKNTHRYYKCSDFDINNECIQNNCKITDVNKLFNNTKKCESKNK
jgi:hypothetical protein